MFILDLLGAVLVPAIVESSVWNVLRARLPMAVIWEAWCLDLVVAAFIGFMMYRMWRSATSKWVWVLPALWFALSAVPYAGRSHPSSVLSSTGGFWAHSLGGSCASQVMDCRDFFAFSVPLIRSVSYSLAAAFASRILSPVTSRLES
jgi:hypothetical protein